MPCERRWVGILRKCQNSRVAFLMDARCGILTFYVARPHWNRGAVGLFLAENDEFPLLCSPILGGTIAFM